SPLHTLPRPGAPGTQRGAILGTPAYMAPEQARGEHGRVSPATDVHALGAVFYEMVTGRPPFAGSSTMETLLQVPDQAPAPLRQHNAGLPATLEAVCARCLAKDPAERYPDAGALADELQHCWHGATRGRRFGRLAAAAGVMVAVLHAVQLLVPGSSGVNRG